jgi:hypothetical protein
MAIRSITNREKRKEEDKESSDKVSNTIAAEVQESPKVKMGHNTEDTTTFTEVFDSSKYDSITEMKKSADIQEEEHLKEVSSGVEKEEPAELAITDIQTSNVDIDSSPTTETATDTSQPNLEEKAAKLRGSKPEQIIDTSPSDNKEESQEELVEIKDKKAEEETRLSDGLADPYTIFWRDLTESWTDLYAASARNVAEITGYWLDLFSTPWSADRKTKDKM